MTLSINVSVDMNNDETGGVDTFRYAMDGSKTYLEKNGEPYGDPVGDKLLCSMAHALEGNVLIHMHMLEFCHQALSNLTGTVIAIFPDVDNAMKALDGVLLEGETTGTLAIVEQNLDTITFDDGKYRYKAESSHDNSQCLRYGEDWRDTSGDEAHYAFAYNNQAAVLSQQVLLKALTELTQAITDENNHPDFSEVSAVYSAMIELQAMLKNPSTSGLYELGKEIEAKFNLYQKQNNQSAAKPVQPLCSPKVEQ